MFDEYRNNYYSSHPSSHDDVLTLTSKNVVVGMVGTILRGIVGLQIGYGLSSTWSGSASIRDPS